jgi:hypothetical protein
MYKLVTGAKDKPEAKLLHRNPIAQSFDSVRVASPVDRVVLYKNIYTSLAWRKRLALSGRSLMLCICIYDI